MRPFLDEDPSAVGSGQGQGDRLGWVRASVRIHGDLADTVPAGKREVEVVFQSAERAGGKRMRRSGGGCKPLGERDRKLRAALERKLDPVTQGIR